MAKVTIHPYHVTVKNTSFDFSKFTQIFHKNNLNDNALPLYEDGVIFLLIIDAKKGDFLRGKFMRLRTDAPPVLDLDTGIDQPFPLGPNQVLEEISHFIWNLKDSVLFGESNYYAIRYYKTQFTDYLNSIFLKREIADEVAEFDLILDADTYASYKKDSSPITAYKFAVAEARADFLNTAQNQSPTRFTGNLASGDGFYLTCNWSRGRKKTKRWIFPRKEIDKDIQKRLQDENTKLLQVTTEEGAYNILGKNKAEYSVECKKVGKIVEDAEEFYSQATTKYFEKIRTLKTYIKITD
jgi:hypothetical protein